MRYNCVIYAFARAIKVSPEELVEALPHDGLSQLPDSNVQRSHHIQEIIDVASEKNIWFCPIELAPQALYTQVNRVYPVFFGNDIVGNFKRFKKYLKDSTGVVTGIRGRIGHAAFWNGERCEDDRGNWDLWEPDGDFTPSTYWRAVWAT